MNHEPKADCYSAGERAAMERYQRLRERWLGPLLRTLVWLGITPDYLTFVALLFGLAFCPLYFWSPLAAFAALLLHLMLDGLDGPLARHAGVASRAGSFTDTLCDQIVVAATTFVLMPQPIHIWSGGMYVFMYTLVVVFAMVRNALGIPYSWLVRPRLIVYGWLVVEVFWLRETPWAGSVNYLLWALNGLLAWKLMTGYWNLRRRLRER